MNFEPEGGFYRWQPSAVLRVAGSDALNFLQGQFTNDLRKPVANEAIYGLWLNQKGKVVADSFVTPVEGAEARWVVSYFSPAAVIRERLEAFIIADDVTVEDRTVEWAAVTIFGDVDRDALMAAVSGSVVFTGRRERGAHTEWIFPAAVAEQAMGGLTGERELTATEVMARRIQAGIPAVPADLGLGELPNEGGLEAEAISYTKGCYLGQEVMARLKSMGQVRRRLLRVTGAASVPMGLPAALYQGERKIGELRSAVASAEGGFAGLALLSLVNLQAATGLSLEPNGAAVVTVAEPV